MIADRLDAGLSVIASNLAEDFQISEDAIRRDLRALAAEGRSKRAYWGALPVSSASRSLTERSPLEFVHELVVRHRTRSPLLATLGKAGTTVLTADEPIQAVATGVWHVIRR